MGSAPRENRMAVPYVWWSMASEHICPFPAGPYRANHEFLTGASPRKDCRGTRLPHFCLKLKQIRPVHGGNWVRQARSLPLRSLHGFQSELLTCWDFLQFKVDIDSFFDTTPNPRGHSTRLLFAPLFRPGDTPHFFKTGSKSDLLYSCADQGRPRVKRCRCPPPRPGEPSTVSTERCSRQTGDDSIPGGTQVHEQVDVSDGVRSPDQFFA